VYFSGRRASHKYWRLGILIIGIRPVTSAISYWQIKTTMSDIFRLLAGPVE
jgi:hypothetical protein